MRDLLLVGFLFVAIFYTFKRPSIGVAAWIWIALTAPTEWAFGFSQSFRLNLTIVLVTVLSYLFVQKDKSFKMNGISVFILFFAFWSFVTTLATDTMFPQAVWNYMVQFQKVVLLFVFITLTVKNRVHVDTLIWAIVLSISSYAAMEATKFILSGGSHRIEGKAGIIYDRNDLAVAINMCIPLIVYLYNTVTSKLLKQGLTVLLLMNVVAIIGTYSRGGFIGLMILAFAFWLSSNRKMVYGVIAALMIPVALVNAPDDWKERQNTVSTAATEDGSFIGRLWAWKVSVLIANDDPLTGGGFHAVKDRGLWGYYAPYTAGFGPIDTPPIPPELKPKAAHNIYMQVLGDHGYVGLAIFLTFLAQTFFLNMRNGRRAREHGQAWCAYLSKMLNLSIIGYGITGGNVSLAYFDLLYAICGIVCVISMYQMYQGKPAPEDEMPKDAVPSA